MIHPLDDKTIKDSSTLYDALFPLFEAFDTSPSIKVQCCLMLAITIASRDAHVRSPKQANVDFLNTLIADLNEYSNSPTTTPTTPNDPMELAEQEFLKALDNLLKDQ